MTKEPKESPRHALLTSRPRFSNRTAWPREPNPLARAIEARRASGEPLFDLTTSNPTRVELDQSMFPHAFPIGPYEPAPLGLASAREAVSAYYAHRGIDVDPSRIVIVASTSEAYGYLFRVLCEVGDAVLTPTPSYPLFEFLASLADVAPVPYTLAFDGSWFLDRSSLPGPAPHTKAAIVVSPNNPTGSLLDADDLAFLDQNLPADCALISDEVFADYVDGSFGYKRASHIRDQARLTFSLNGLSKVAGLPQHKLGWIVASGPGDLVAEAIERLEIVADTYLSVGTGIQRALPDILRASAPFQASLDARIRQNLAILDRSLAGTALRIRKRDGGWSAFIDLPRTESDEAWAVDFVEREGAVVHPGYLFGATHGIVVSLIVPTHLFDEGINRIVRHVARTLG
ncbi:MAG: pyridoxal phosphate-dependent aminotransferase [Deltaproteobacteria bacterium]|nr:pyridoxal phosphate-dependent aminotransferase [Deltaproteobacteria bacterium]